MPCNSSEIIRYHPQNWIGFEGSNKQYCHQQLFRATSPAFKKPTINSVVETYYFMDTLVCFILPNTLRLGKKHPTEVGKQILPLSRVGENIRQCGYNSIVNGEGGWDAL